MRTREGEGRRKGGREREAQQGKEETGKRGISPPRSFLKVGDYVQL